MKTLETKKLTDFTGWDLKQMDYMFVDRTDKEKIIKSYIDNNRAEKYGKADKWYLAADNEFFFTIARVSGRILYAYSFEYN